MLAGVGLSWYTWLEQGRDITPSPSVLDALARVLDLDPAEHKHLFDLAGVPVPTVAASYPTEAPAELRAIVAELDPNPAYLLGPRTDVLGWNAAAERLLGTPTRAPDRVPNLLWWAFTDPKDGSPARAATARNTLARFRRELWRRHEVSDRQLGTKRADHPALGTLVLHHLQSIPTSHPDLRLTQFVPADEATRTALSRAAEDARQTS